MNPHAVQWTEVKRGGLCGGKPHLEQDLSPQELVAAHAAAGDRPSPGAGEEQGTAGRLDPAPEKGEGESPPSEMVRPGIDEGLHGRPILSSTDGTCEGVEHLSGCPVYTR